MYVQLTNIDYYMRGYVRYRVRKIVSGYHIVSSNKTREISNNILLIKRNLTKSH